MIDQVQTEEHESVVHDLHMVCQHQRPDRGRQEPDTEHVASLKQRVREKDNEGKVTERHELRAVSLAGEADHVRAEHERQCSDQCCGTREAPHPHQGKHEESAEEVVDHKPCPRTVQIEKIEHPLYGSLRIAHVMRNKGDIPERRHPAEKIRHPERIHPFRLFNFSSDMGVAERCGGVPL